jgi:hypothetical protein
LDATCVGSAVGVFVGIPLVGDNAGDTDGARVVTVKEFIVHCIFVSAAVGPHDDVPVPYDVPTSNAPNKYDVPHSWDFDGKHP